MAQTTSKLWKSLWRMSNTEREYKFEINGVEYGPDQEVEHSYSNGLFEDFGIGNAYTASLKTASLRHNIPKAATIKRYVRLKNRTPGFRMDSEGHILHQPQERGRRLLDAGSL